MTPQEFRVALALRLLIPLTNAERPCEAQGCSLILDSFGYHALNCGGRGNLHKNRHDLVRDAIFDISLVAGFSPAKDGPVQCLGVSNTGIHQYRPADLLIKGDDFTHTCVDVTVVNPLSQPFPRGYAFGKAVNDAEISKINEHRQPCQLASYGFHPFAIDVFGSMGKESSILIN